MSTNTITMRIIQRFDPRHESQFMALEKRFAELEAARPDYPKGARLQPISAGEPVNTLIWECDFPNLDAAQRALDLFAGDGAHEELFRDQAPFINDVRIEFYRRLLFSPEGNKSS